MSYGGWDDPRFVLGSEEDGESDQFQSFFISVGINDRKYVFMFVSGFVSALVISRVRVSSIVVFPACVVVFAAGFLLGFVRWRGKGSMGANHIKASSEDNSFRVYKENIGNLMGFFNGLDGKVSDLKIGIERAIVQKQITVTDLDNYVRVIESIRLSAFSAKNVVVSSIDRLDILGNVVESICVLDVNQKPNKRKKEIGSRWFEFFRFFGGFLGVDSLGLKTEKKDIAGQESMMTNVNNNKQCAEGPQAKESVLNSANDSTRIANFNFSGDASNVSPRILDTNEKVTDRNGRINMVLKNGKMDSSIINSSPKSPVDNEQSNYHNNGSRFMKGHQISLRMGHNNELEARGFSCPSSDSLGFRDSMKYMRVDLSSEQEEELKNTYGACMPHHKKDGDNIQSIESDSRSRQERANPKDCCHLANTQHTDESEIGDVGHSFSSMASDDVVIDRYLREANDLLKQARVCLRNGGDEGHAELLLYKSANILTKAVAMNPTSLLAVGQLGNTFLVLGELKLKISREMRSQLSRYYTSLVEKQVKGPKKIDDQVRSRDEIISVLVNVCEECEELLLEAGRKYRLALSIDGNDVRALYNWGLALSFRAQLIADIGPEAASDADKVFLAAIDKFDAMMSKSSIYAPNALFRWGMALQQRSRLRSRNSKEKVKLLQQAKRLYEDALEMDSESTQVREALSSCVLELNYKQL